eukprot:740041-Amphidinium_carterae.1
MLPSMGSESGLPFGFRGCLALPDPMQVLGAWCIGVRLGKLAWSQCCERELLLLERFLGAAVQQLCAEHLALDLGFRAPAVRSPPIFF